MYNVHITFCVDNDGSVIATCVSFERDRKRKKTTEWGRTGIKNDNDEEGKNANKRMNKKKSPFCSKVVHKLPSPWRRRETSNITCTKHSHVLRFIYAYVCKSNVRINVLTSGKSQVAGRKSQIHITSGYISEKDIR